MSETRLRSAIRRALRLLDEAMGDTDVTHRDDPLARAYRTLDNAARRPSSERGTE